MGKQSRFRIRAIPLPIDLTKLLQDRVQVLRALADKACISTQALADVEELRKDMKTFVGDRFEPLMVDRIVSFGPRRTGPNILVNLAEDLDAGTVFTTRWGVTKDVDKRKELISSLVNGFQLATFAGPLCEEPMMGLGFIIESWEQ